MPKPNPNPSPNEQESQEAQAGSLYKIAQVAQYLQVSEDTVRRMMDRGDLAYVECPQRGRRVVPKDLRQFVLSRRREGGKRGLKKATSPPPS